MSRKEDIDFLDQKIKEHLRDRSDLASKFELFKLGLNKEMRVLLEEAGILTEFQKIEKRVENRKLEDQKVIDNISTEISELERIKKFLIERDKNDEDLKKKFPISRKTL
jgi:hypothetical protein